MALDVILQKINKRQRALSLLVLKIWTTISCSTKNVKYTAFLARTLKKEISSKLCKQ